MEIIVKTRTAELVEEYRYQQFVDTRKMPTQEDIAQQIGIDPATLSRYINSDPKLLSGETISKIRRFFDVSYDDFLIEIDIEESV